MIRCAFSRRPFLYDRLSFSTRVNFYDKYAVKRARRADNDAALSNVSSSSGVQLNLNIRVCSLLSNSSMFCVINVVGWFGQVRKTRKLGSWNDNFDLAFLF